MSKNVVVRDKSVVKNVVKNGKNELDYSNDSKLRQSSKISPIGVKKKVIEYESKKTQRSKVKLSPNKLKLKKVSEKLKDKMYKYEDKIDKIEVKEVKLDKINMIKSLKENINMKEDSLGNNSEIDTMKKNDVMQIKNAFELMFESAKGGKLKPITPKRKKSKVKVASIERRGE